jgi:hypothetical protein
MGEVIRFIPKSERARARFIREARTRYDSILPPGDPFSGRPDTAPAGHSVGGANAYRSDGALVIKIIAGSAISPLRQIATSRPSPPQTSLTFRCSPA